MKMTEDALLRLLNAESDAARNFRDDQSQQRTRAIRAYLRKPYGTEQEGRSQVVASDVFDAVEGILPDIVEVFASSDKAVVFDPVGPEDEQGAEQASNACNHVFYKQNNGFLNLYTAAKDALLLRTGGWKWYWEEKRCPTWTTYKNVDELQLAAFLAANPDAEVVDKEEYEPDESQEDGPLPPIDGVQRYTVKIKTVKESGKVRVVCIPPDELEVSRRHNSVLLDECPYVAHVREVTLSEAREMGYDVTIEDIKGATRNNQENDYREQFRDRHVQEQTTEDDSMRRGWLHEEYVLCDFDGDGVAERRKVVRLGQKLLENVEFSHVPIAAWTPYILTHRFEGLSVHDLVEDFQRTRTDIWRNQLDNLDLANNQETVVLTDSQGNPQANIDDLLNRRPGGLMREKVQGAIRPYVERWQGIEANPMLEALEVAKENRTGYTRYSQGLDSDSLNQTATGISKIMNASQKRMKLMSRIMAECMVVPAMRGIFKTLTDYCMEKLSFRLNGQFVQYDPQEWRDGYDMTVNVGIGTGDQIQQGQFLMQLAQAQFALMQSPMAHLIDPQNVYNAQARLIENAGFKNPGEFITDPKTRPPPPPMQPPPDPKLQIEQMRLQADAQKFQAQMGADAQKFQAETSMQMQIDQNRQEWEARQKQLELEQTAQLEQLRAQYAAQQEAQRLAFDKWKAELDANVKLSIAQQPAQDAAPMASKMDELMAYITAPSEIVRGPDGMAIGVKKAGKTFNVQRDQQGRAMGLQ